MLYKFLSICLAQQKLIYILQHSRGFLAYHQVSSYVLWAKRLGIYFSRFDFLHFCLQFSLVATKFNHELREQKIRESLSQQPADEINFLSSIARWKWGENMIVHKRTCFSFAAMKFLQ